jgi:hypothetical protein
MPLPAAAASLPAVPLQLLLPLLLRPLPLRRYAAALLPRCAAADAASAARLPSGEGKSQSREGLPLRRCRCTTAGYATVVAAAVAAAAIAHAPLCCWPLRQCALAPQTVRAKPEPKRVKPAAAAPLPAVPLQLPLPLLLLPLPLRRYATGHCAAAPMRRRRCRQHCTPPEPQGRS